MVLALLVGWTDVAGAADAECSGTVVNLSCDSVRPSGGIARCDPGEPVFALAVAGRTGLQPLVLDAGPPFQQLRAGAYTGRQVRVVGSCPPSGAIHVEEIEPIG